MKIASFITLAAAGVVLASCGSHEADAPAAVGGTMSSLEPIDAVPLPLDENPMPRATYVAQVASPADKPVTAEKTAAVAATEPATTATTTVAAVAPAAPAETRPPRIVVAPRPVTTVAPPAPAPAPAPAPQPRATSNEPERPVLNF